MSSTVTQIVNRFIDETQIGVYGSGTFAATTLTDTTQLQNSNYQGNEFRRYWLGYLDSTTAADRAKPIGTNSIVGTTGVLTHAGSNISGTGSSKNYTVTKPDWHPTRYIVPLVNRALEMCYEWWREPLSIIDNAGGEASSVGGSDSSATTTRNTTAAYVFDGQASLKVANSGADGYHQYATFDAAPSMPYTLGIWVRIASGTATLTLVNVSASSATIGSTTASGTGAWQYLQISGTLPSTCYQAALRVGGQESNAETYWDNACIYWTPVTKITGPSWVIQWRDETGQPLFRLLQQRNRNGYDGTSPGRAYDWRLIEEGQYQVLNAPGAANAVEFELHKKLTSPAYPIIIEARRPYSDFGTLAAGTESTTCPLILVVKAMKRIAANDRRMPQADKEFGGNDAFKQEWEKEQRRYTSQLELPPVGNVTGLSWAVWR